MSSRCFTSWAYCATVWPPSLAGDSPWPRRSTLTTRKRSASAACCARRSGATCRRRGSGRPAGPCPRRRRRGGRRREARGSGSWRTILSADAHRHDPDGQPDDGDAHDLPPAQALAEERHGHDRADRAELGGEHAARPRPGRDRRPPRRRSRRSRPPRPRSRRATSSSARPSPAPSTSAIGSMTATALPRTSRNAQPAPRSWAIGAESASTTPQTTAATIAGTTPARSSRPRPAETSTTPTTASGRPSEDEPVHLLAPGQGEAARRRRPRSR